jgi:GNAT superfamily N-acetyltransferase
VAEREDQIVGFGLLNLGGSIALLYVSPAARFSGVSKAILTAIEREAIAAGLKQLKLESTVTALRFYSGAGYRQTGSRVAGFGATFGYPMARDFAVDQLSSGTRSNSKEGG